MNFDHDFLNEGSNTITVECPRDGGIINEQVYTNWFELDYSRGYAASNNLLAFANDQAGRLEFEVTGFATSDISVFDITDPLTPARITGGAISADGSLQKINFDQTTSGARKFLALTPARWILQPTITADAPSNLRSSANGADYIIISHANFLTAVQPLAAYRAGQRLRVMVVDVQDVYDQFSGGVYDPQAIQSFLAYAYANWVRPAPAYVLLVGDGHLRL